MDGPLDAQEAAEGSNGSLLVPQPAPPSEEQQVLTGTIPYVRAEQERRAAAAQRQLDQLGKVNPLALEEFAALEERHAFLATQLEDLKKTRRDLLTVVKEVDDRVQEVFASAFEDTAREFEEIFSRLFPGGEGRLILTEPDDMLATGIDFEARPPGKKVKRMSLLSGGERSLTAIAFLLAIFKARPVAVLRAGRGRGRARRHQHAAPAAHLRGAAGQRPSCSSSPTRSAPWRSPTRCTGSACGATAVSAVVSQRLRERETRLTSQRPAAAADAVQRARASGRLSTGGCGPGLDRPSAARAPSHQRPDSAARGVCQTGAVMELVIILIVVAVLVVGGLGDHVPGPARAAGGSARRPGRPCRARKPGQTAAPPAGRGRHRGQAGGRSAARRRGLPPVAEPAPPRGARRRLRGRLTRLRGRLAASRGGFGSALLNLLSRDALDDQAWEDIEDTLITADMGVAPSRQITEELRTQVKVTGTRDPDAGPRDAAHRAHPRRSGRTWTGPCTPARTATGPPSCSWWGSTGPARPRSAASSPGR